MNGKNIQKMGQKGDAFHNLKRTDADTNAVEEEMSRAGENARNGCVRSEDVTRESDEKDTRIQQNWLKCIRGRANRSRGIRRGDAKTQLA